MKTKEQNPKERKASLTPKNICVNTQATGDDIIAASKPDSEGVSEMEVEEAVTMINPDANSMDSRG